MIYTCENVIGFHIDRPEVHTRPRFVDAHNTGSHQPRMSAAFDRISARLGKDTACLVCMKNPSTVIRGRDMSAISQCSLREVV
jgi:hypothetical protein